jgi:hypothetical protein
MPEQRRIVARIEELAGKIVEVRRLRSESTLAVSTLARSGAYGIVNQLSGERIVRMGEIVSIRGRCLEPW